MFKREKLFYFFILVSALTLFNSLFFFYYYQSLNLRVSALTVLFVFLFSLNFGLIFHLLKNRILKIICASSFLLFILYSLINFAYYDVFRIFWKINTNQISGLNRAQSDLLLSYYNLIPTGIYVASAVLLILTSISLYLYSLKRRTIYNKIIRSIDFLQNKRTIRPTAAWLIVLCIISLNIFSVFLLANYKARLSSREFDKSQYYSDLGVYGFSLDRLYSALAQIPKTLAKTETPAPSSNLSSLKGSLQKLATLPIRAERTPVKVAAKTDRPHIIIYQMESVGAWALKQDPSPMPFLSKLMAENITVGHFFSNSCTTINSELAASCSFYPESTGPVSDLFSYNNYYCLPEILKDKFNYTTAVYHANAANFWHRDVLYPRWGYNRLYFTPDYKLRASDHEVLNDVVAKMKASTGPTFNYVIGFTSHGPHNQEFIDLNHYENNLDIIPYSFPLSENSRLAATDETTIRNYFGFLTAVDNDIKDLFDQLSANNLLDKTIVIIYGDHRYYSFSSGNSAADFNNYNEVPFVMYVPGAYRGKTQEIASQVDIAPTLLDLIGGADDDKPPYFVGTSLFSADHPNSVVSKCLGEDDYVDENIIIKNEKLLNTFQPLIFSQKYASIKYNDYVAAFSDVISRSDSILTNNEISKQIGVAASGTAPSSVREIDFNQSTDSDKDGLSDLRESALGLDPHNPDTDGDGYLDGVEVINGYNPKGAGKSGQ